MQLVNKQQPQQATQSTTYRQNNMDRVTPETDAMLKNLENLLMARRRKQNIRLVK